MTDPNAPIATPSQTVGPFFHFGLATNDALGRVAGPDVSGERLRLRVRVLDGDGLPVPDALIEIYQANALGAYPPQFSESESSATAAFAGFGRLPTDGDGACVFETVKPGPVRGGRGQQAPHINVCVFARGLLRQVYTRLYFAGDPGHGEDPILRLVPVERAQTLIATRLRNDEDTPESRVSNPGSHASTWEFTVRLQGHDETVFFDL